ncbi:MAG: indolepyruvate oxidoreductase subunit beta [Bacteroidales bacterium]|jgi:indolepyruvate ferredoxin oxidoreductase beta subunit|nr:indolepyruvate oxidoreductase subunit beta [Bacteroidales bacterium]MCK9448922.1 indolepyruvate oxidoreductase subunit beta [Bacteroidales bacterium]MDD3701319.1 indolepyruvate oxidoreductase subunit beta [Bacteroidales bacterium]MDY0370550.1 indolepyruvate oxidoreductase subunit beta [Bacteroidales bacterium]
MKKDIILAGVGGQGILSIAACIGLAALAENLFLKQAEVHGMSQRGGAVQSHLRIASDPIASDLIPEGKADLIISVEPMESLRYLPMLHRNGWIISSMNPFVNIPDYPQVEVVLDEIWKQNRYITLDADAIAKECGSVKSANIVVLGAASPFLDLKYETLQNAVMQLFASKGDDIVELNLKALQAGKEYALKHS